MASEKFRRHRFAGHGGLHFTVAFIEDNRFARIFAGLAADLGEERRETIIVVHRPAIERMVMALRALDSHPHKDLRRIFGCLESVCLNLVIVCSRALKSASRSR